MCMLNFTLKLGLHVISRFACASNIKKGKSK